MTEPFISGGRWKYKVRRSDGAEKTFTSVKEGMAGKRAVMKRAREWLEGTYRRSGGKVKDYWEPFLEYYKKMHGGETEGYYLIKEKGKNYIIPELGNYHVADLRYKVLQNFLFNVTLQNGKTPSKKTLEHIRSSLNQFLRYMALIEEVCEPIAIPLQLPPLSPPQKERQILQPENIRYLFSLDTSNSHYAYAFQFCLATGLRTGELIGLQVSDYDPEKNILTINRAINGRQKITSGKNDNAQRSFVLNSVAQEVLLKQLEYIKEYDSIWIFADQKGRIPTQRKLNCAYDKLQLPGSVYSLRHTFVSLMKYIDISSLKRILGHSASMPTLETYSHLIEGEQKHDAEIISAELKRRIGIDEKEDE